MTGRDSRRPRAAAPWTRRRSARWAIGSSIRSPRLLESLPRGPSRATSRRRRCARRSTSRVRCPEQGTDRRAAARRDGRAAVRALALQRASALLRLHHRAAGADRDAGRPARRGGEPERRRVDAVAGGHRDRGADGALDRRADRLSGRLRRPARQRRQHGELRRASSPRARPRRLGRARRRACRRIGARCASTPRARRTRGSRRRPTSPASAPRRSAGFRPTPRCAWTSPRCSRQIDADIAAGDVPCIVVGTAGSVSTGAVDPLRGDRASLPGVRRLVPRRRRLWRVRRRACRTRRAICARCALADSVAVDPHKWLYAPLEAGCALVRESGRAARRVRLPPARTTTSTSRRRTTSTTVRRTRAASARSRSGWRCGRSGARAIAR